MTNTIAIWLAVLILGAVVLDAVMLQGQSALFVARRGLDLIRYVAFWR